MFCSGTVPECGIIRLTDLQKISLISNIKKSAEPGDRRADATTTAAGGEEGDQPQAQGQERSERRGAQQDPVLPAAESQAAADDHFQDLHIRVCLGLWGLPEARGQRRGRQHHQPEVARQDQHGQSDQRVRRVRARDLRLEYQVQHLLSADFQARVRLLPGRGDGQLRGVDAAAAEHRGADQAAAYGGDHGHYRLGQVLVPGFAAADEPEVGADHWLVGYRQDGDHQEHAEKLDYDGI